MDSLNVQITPQKTAKPGSYPIFSSDALICPNIIREELGGLGRLFDDISIISDPALGVPNPPSENDIPPGYVIGIYEPIKNNEGDNWCQTSTYGAYTNPQYWSDCSTTNQWCRQDKILTFTVTQECGGDLPPVVVQTFTFPDITYLIYFSGEYVTGCTPDKAYTLNADGTVTFNFAVSLPATPSRPAAGDLIISAGTYGPPGPCGCSCTDGRGTIDACENVQVISAGGGYRYITNGCILARQKAVLPGCEGCDCECQSSTGAAVAFWAHTGAYGGPDKGTGQWDLGCSGATPTIPPFVPECARPRT